MAYITPLTLPVIQDGTLINQGHFAILAEKVNELVNAHNGEDVPLIDADSMRYIRSDNYASAPCRTYALVEVTDNTDFELVVNVPQDCPYKLGIVNRSDQGMALIEQLSKDSENPSPYSMFSTNVSAGTLYDGGWLLPGNSRIINQTIQFASSTAGFHIYIADANASVPYVIVTPEQLIASGITISVKNIKHI